VAAGVYPNPFPHVDVVTTWTNKNLRGPRGGLIRCDDDAIASKLHRGVFQGVQGGPLPEYIAAKAVCFGEALTPAFGNWAEAVLDNARTLAAALQERALGGRAHGSRLHRTEFTSPTRAITAASLHLPLGSVNDMNVSAPATAGVRRRPRICTPRFRWAR
jgi:glycine hydroxymethyltransferase